ncbi:GntR family transcriptional regulator [Thermocladium modestius]|uniref:GntR family transcriptional regulator n=1 Tax=Thermocladium modestius TaxID=62609 RepID=A0A830GUH9_9CREN|nr:GntR family transcriptional regulator [Thermocladium modestius]GGP19443.1 GntR family transcriptional regulator [Thermocladium modestius]
MPSLSEKVYKELLSNIVAGKFRLGESLREDTLASMLNVSRTPVREALARLERDGLVVKKGKSYTIIPLTRDDVLQLYEVRKPLEALAAELAARRITDDQARELQNLANRMKEEAAKQDPDPVLLADLNGKIHNSIANIGGNKYLAEFLNEIRLKLMIVRVTLFTTYGRRIEEVMEHSAIIDAVVSRDAKLARDKMEIHMSNVVKDVESKILPLLFPSRM